MNLTIRSEKITHDAWNYGIRVVQSVKTRKLTRLEKVGEVGSDRTVTGETWNAWVDGKIRVFNLRIEYGPQYPDYWAQK
jgi:hypothetical protein